MNAETQRKVFISYGHDDEAKTTVAKFVGELGPKANRLLTNSLSKGQTLIDKLEEIMQTTAGFRNCFVDSLTTLVLFKR